MTQQEAIKINYDKVQQEANNILGGIGLHWDDLADTNSIWDFICEDMSENSIKDTAKDVCWDRLESDGMPGQMATNIIYGKDD